MFNCTFARFIFPSTAKSPAHFSSQKFKFDLNFTLNVQDTSVVSLFQSQRPHIFSNPIFVIFAIPSNDCQILSAKIFFTHFSAKQIRQLVRFKSSFQPGKINPPNSVNDENFVIQISYTDEVRSWRKYFVEKRMKTSKNQDLFVSAVR